MAPTRDGWRELKMALLPEAAGRRAGRAAADWAGRDLPPPTARSAYATIGRLRGVLGPVGPAGRRRWGSTRPGR